MAVFDLVITGARVVDPASGLDGTRDIGIAEGKIAEIGGEGMTGRAARVLEADGLVVLPGLIDIHTHLGKAFGGCLGGCHMLAKAGVCTTLEMSGPADQVFALMRDYGSGICVATLDAALPGTTLSGTDPDEAEAAAFVTRTLESGAVGTKLLGGHFPFSPEGSRAIMQACARQNAYFAWHCGSTATGSNMHGLREFFEITDGHCAHLAHVNSYCRGLTAPALDEVAEALTLLQAHPKIFAESYIAPINGTTLRIGADGRCASGSTGQTLKALGFEDSAAGMEAAIRAGTARVFSASGLETAIMSSDAGVALWLAQGTNTSGCFDVNPAASRMALFLARDKTGAFAVDALSTDGGAIPRNVMVEQGLALVNAKALSLADFAGKASHAPARHLNLPNKGHLGLGADADITIVDLAAAKPVSTIVGGVIVMHRGVVFGTGGTIITTKRGEAKARATGLPVIVTEYAGWPA